MIFSILIFLFGACLGSFLNVVIIRWKNASSILGRSACPNCRKQIRPQHLVPILSWIVLRGRCADCHQPIHFQYPLVEMGAALLTVFAFFRHDFFSTHAALEPFLFELIFTLVLLIISVFDLRWKLVPVELLLAGTVIFTLWNFLLARHSLWSLVKIGRAHV